jgi:uncharacterized protein
MKADCAPILRLEVDVAVPSLGVGLPYLASLGPDLYQSGLLDFVEVRPETFCRQRPEGKRGALDLVSERIERAREICGALPIVVHGSELSISAARGWNNAYVKMLDEFQACWPFVWHSAPLSFEPEGAARIVMARAAEIGERYGVPFLLANPAHYLAGLPTDPEIGDEGGLMRAIIEGSDCFQLLDLHNVYCNAINHRSDPFAVIDSMPLDRVLEIHVAGGSWLDGFWMDAQDGRVPQAVWGLLEYTLPRAPNAGGVVLDMLDEHAVALGPEVVAEELNRAHNVWRRWRGA